MPTNPHLITDAQWWSIGIAAVQGLCTVLIAGIVGYVAWRQWKLAQDKVAIDLFDKRFAAMKAIDVTWASAVMKVENPAPRDTIADAMAALADLGVALGDAEWLFGEDVLAPLKAGKDVLMQRAGEIHDDDIDDTAATFRRLALHSEAYQSAQTAARRYMMLTQVAVKRPR